MSHNVKHEQNSGFSLIELLIAIAILAMLTVPLMNSFIMSGKINRNRRRLQNAAAVAQSVAETAKHTTDKAALEAALKALPGVYDFPADSKVNEDSPVYTFKLDGADGEKFRVNVSLMPKTDYDYKATDFADLYNEASVIYSELILNDNKVLSLMRSQKIPYDVPGAPVMEKWNVTEGRWDSYSPSDEDKAIRDTYGNLFADEYLKSSGSLDGISESELTDVNSEFKKENIDKTVDINIEQVGNDYEVTINTIYTFDFTDYKVVYRAEDTSPGVIVTLGAGTPMTFYRCSGKLVYKADEIKLTLDNEKPLYFLYAKAEGGRISSDGITLEKAADVRHFKSVTYNVNAASGVQLTNEDGTSRNMKLYFVEEAGERQEESFKINVDNSSLTTALDLYTTEIYNTLGAALSVNVNNAIKGVVNVYSTRDAANTDNHIAYEKGEEITSLYKIIVSVDYDADRDGGYSEHVYSVATDD